MEAGWPLFAWLLSMLGIAWFWHDSLGARERANEAAEEACRNTGARLLDGTVAFRRLRPVRVAGGSMSLQRTYVFDYTLDGVQRQQGFVVLTGQRVDAVGLQ